MDLLTHPFLRPKLARLYAGLLLGLSQSHHLRIHVEVRTGPLRANTARVNLKHVWQEFSVADLRALLGVKPGRLTRVPNLLQPYSR